MILFNVPESTKTEVKDEIEEDTTHVNNILNHIDTRVSTDPDNITFIRLGLGKKLGLGTRPRPIKITFNNNRQKWSVLSNSSKLRESEDYKKVNVSEDKTFQEQQADKKLKKQLDDLKKETGLDYTIFAKKIMLRGRHSTIQEGQSERKRH